MVLEVTEERGFVDKENEQIKRNYWKNPRRTNESLM